MTPKVKWLIILSTSLVILALISALVLYFYPSFFEKTAPISPPKDVLGNVLAFGVSKENFPGETTYVLTGYFTGTPFKEKAEYVGRVIVPVGKQSLTLKIFLGKPEREISTQRVTSNKPSANGEPPVVINTIKAISAS